MRAPAILSIELDARFCVGPVCPCALGTCPQPLSWDRENRIGSVTRQFAFVIVFTAWRRVSRHPHTCHTNNFSHPPIITSRATTPSRDRDLLTPRRMSVRIGCVRPGRFLQILGGRNLVVVQAAPQRVRVMRRMRGGRVWWGRGARARAGARGRRFMLPRTGVLGVSGRTSSCAPSVMSHAPHAHWRLRRAFKTRVSAPRGAHEQFFARGRGGPVAPRGGGGGGADAGCDIVTARLFWRSIAESESDEPCANGVPRAARSGDAGRGAEDMGGRGVLEATPVQGIAVRCRPAAAPGTAGGAATRCTTLLVMRHLCAEGRAVAGARTSGTVAWLCGGGAPLWVLVRACGFIQGPLLVEESEATTAAAGIMVRRAAAEGHA